MEAEIEEADEGTTKGVTGATTIAGIGEEGEEEGVDEGPRTTVGVIGFARSDERSTHVLSTHTTIILERGINHIESKKVHNKNKNNRKT